MLRKLSNIYLQSNNFLSFNLQKIGKYFLFNFGTIQKNYKDIEITVIKNGLEKIIKTDKEGQKLFELLKEKVNLMTACEGNCACSTCHIIFDRKTYEKLDKPNENELDMLEQAFGLTDTSRLSCQIEINDKINGSKITIPSQTRNLL